MCIRSTQFFIRSPCKCIRSYIIYSETPFKLQSLDTVQYNSPRIKNLLIKNSINIKKKKKQTKNKNKNKTKLKLNNAAHFLSIYK